MSERDFDATAVFETATCRHRADDYVGAAAAYRRLIVDDPLHGDAWHGLGVLALQAEDLDRAARLLMRALGTGRGERFRMWFHIGVVSDKMGLTDKAIEAYLAAIRVNSDYEPGYRVLLDVLTRLKRWSDVAEVATALGRRHFRCGDPEAAMAAYERALTAEPRWKPALLALAPLRRFYGQSAAAEEAYRRVIEDDGLDLGARLGMCAARLRIIHPDAEDVRVRRSAYIRELASLHHLAMTADDDRLAEAEHAVGDCKPFYLNYHGLDDSDLMRLYGGVVDRIMGAYLPEFNQPLTPRPGLPGRRIRVGFISTYLYEHSVSKLFTGWLEALDPARFELFAYHLGAGVDAYTDRVRARTVELRHGISGTRNWAQAIRDDQLDALIYLDVGMSGLEVRLASLRLAPAQAVAWGHPVTTGFANMDYFLSSALMEPYNGQDHYTETLVPLPNLSICYQPILYDRDPMSRADLGLRADDLVFTCCQSLYKYPPRHDAAFAMIARQAPRARFVFIQHHLPEVTAAFQARMEKVFAAYGLSASEHCVMADRVPRDQFGGFLDCGDVYLDSIGWSGGNTTLEAAAHDRPIVTLACDLMRGRHSTGILRRLGMDDCIAHDIEGYVSRAVALGLDAGARRRCSERVAAAKGRLYDDAEAAAGLAAFLTRAVNQRA